MWYNINCHLGLPLEEVTIAEMLKGQGYSTAIVGKWHLGVGEDMMYLPKNQGFDYYLVRKALTIIIIYCSSCSHVHNYKVWSKKICELIQCKMCIYLP